MNVTQQGVIVLIKSAVTGQRFKLPEGFVFESEEVQKLIAKHSLFTMAYEGAVKCGISKEIPEMKQLMAKYLKAMFRSELQMRQVQRIFDAFDANGIDYLPTKGCILKKMYRLPELRLMGDADITIRKETCPQIAEVMEQLGFVKCLDTENEFSWKHNELYVEFHRHMRSFYNETYYDDVWERVQKQEGHRYGFSIEDGFIHVFNHFARHYRGGGIGLRQVIDLYVYRNTFSDMDEIYIEQEMTKLRLQHFYKNVLRLLEVWFGEARSDDVTECLAQTIFNSGNWGTVVSHHFSRDAVQINHEGDVSHARIKSIARNVFPTKDFMCERYKILKKVSWLLPVFWFVRGIEVLLFQRKSIKRWTKVWKQMDDDIVNEYQKRYKFVGLDIDGKK